jgi:hypothetical protein
MSRLGDESSLSWFERTIVANSTAADEMNGMETSAMTVNDAARGSIYRRFTDSYSDLTEARGAFRQDRADDRRSEGGAE